MVTQYRTTYLPEAAFLVALGIALVSCEKRDHRTVEFVFNDAEGRIERLAQEYYKNNPRPALNYYRAITQLRGEITNTLGTSRSNGGAR